MSDSSHYSDDLSNEDNINSEKMDIESIIPEEVMQGLAELGLFGLAVPEDFGGLNLDYTLYSRVFQEISGFDGAVATTLGAHQLGIVLFLMKEMKNKNKSGFQSSLQVRSLPLFA